MSPKVLKRALLVGIDEYREFGNLSGCVADVNALAPLLARNADDSPNFSCRALLSGRDSVGRRDLIQAIDDLLKPGAHVAVFYFAGHGVGATNDVSLASSDGDWIEPGVPLSLLLGKAQDAKIEQVVILLDCCHAGGGGSNAMFGANVAILRDGIAILAAARRDQVAKELDGRGEFSTYLCGALTGGAADVRGKVTLAGVYAYLAECFGSWDQRPTFKCNLEDAFEMRCTAPLVTDDVLRRLPDVFATAASELPLDPEYEREYEHRKPEKVKIYDLLTHYRNGKLIEFVGTDYLYWAAMQSKPARLTPHGRHYWNLANKGLL